MTTDNAVLLVTGASSGIGRAAAGEASRCGFHLVLAPRDPDALVEVGRSCADAASVTVVPTDVSDDVSVRSCIDRTLSIHGRLDAVIHCAALLAYGRTEQIPVDVNDTVVGTNLLGSTNLVRHVIPIMRERDRGTLVLIGSVIGHLATPEMTPYVVSKWGVRALAWQLQVENRGRPVCAFAIWRPVRSTHRSTATPPTTAGFSTDRRCQPRHPALRQLDHPRARTPVGPLHRTLRLGFSLAPRLFDAMVGPIIDLTGAEQKVPGRTTTGNVFVPAATLHRAHSGQPSLATHVLKGLAGRVRTKVKHQPDV